MKQLIIIVFVLVSFCPAFCQTSQNPDTNAIILNEIMINPVSGEPVYIEIYNRSGRFIQLNRIGLGRIINGSFTDECQLVSRSVFITPGQYMVLTKSVELFKDVYPQVSSIDLLEVPQMPTFPQYTGNVALATWKGPVWETVKYNRRMLTGAAKRNMGYALERQYFNIPASDSLNWHYSSDSAIFGSPGRVNNIYIPPDTSTKTDYTEEVLVFTPDNDSYNDKAVIIEPFDGTTATAAVLQIFDSKGRQITQLQNPIFNNNKLYITWDGLDNTGKLASEGRYILFISASGGVKKKRDLVLKLGY